MWCVVRAAALSVLLLSPSTPALAQHSYRLVPEGVGPETRRTLEHSFEKRGFVEREDASLHVRVGFRSYSWTVGRSVGRPFDAFRKQRHRGLCAGRMVAETHPGAEELYAAEFARRIEVRSFRQWEKKCRNETQRFVERTAIELRSVLEDSVPEGSPGLDRAATPYRSGDQSASVRGRK